MAQTIDAQPATTQDGQYAGSRYADVAAAIFANPYQRVWGAPGEAPLPVHEVSIRTVVGGLAGLAAPRQLQRDSERTIDSQADLRFGADGKGFPGFYTRTASA